MLCGETAANLQPVVRRKCKPGFPTSRDAGGLDFNMKSEFAMLAIPPTF